MSRATRALAAALPNAAMQQGARPIRRALVTLLLVAAPIAAHADPIATVERNGVLVAIEPYAPGIIRITIATDRGQTGAAPGYGKVAKPDAVG